MASSSNTQNLHPRETLPACVNWQRRPCKACLSRAWHMPSILQLYLVLALKYQDRTQAWHVASACRLQCASSRLGIVGLLPVVQLDGSESLQLSVIPQADLRRLCISDPARKAGHVSSGLVLHKGMAGLQSSCQKRQGMRRVLRTTCRPHTPKHPLLVHQ